MATIFTAKLVESQLPILTRRSTILKRVMWAGIGIALACLIPTFYFSYSAADVNSVSHFVYDFQQSLLDWSRSLPDRNGGLVENVTSAMHTVSNLITILTGVAGFTGLVFVFFRMMRGEDSSEMFLHVAGVLLVVGAGFIGKQFLFPDDTDRGPTVENKVAIALQKRDAVALLEVIKENPEFLNNHVTGHTDLTKIVEDLDYLDIQKNLKESHVDARKAEIFLQSSYFHKGMKSFRPDALTAIEKAAYGHPVSERAEHYQTSVIEPEARKSRILAVISASLMTLGFISGAAAFLLSRIIHRRVSFLKTLSSTEAM